MLRGCPRPSRPREAAGRGVRVSGAESRIKPAVKIALCRCRRVFGSPARRVGDTPPCGRRPVPPGPGRQRGLAGGCPAQRFSILGVRPDSRPVPAEAGPPRTHYRITPEAPGGSRCPWAAGRAPVSQDRNGCLPGELPGLPPGRRHGVGSSDGPGNCPRRGRRPTLAGAPRGHPLKRRVP